MAKNKKIRSKKILRKNVKSAIKSKKGGAEGLLTATKAANTRGELEKSRNLANSNNNKRALSEAIAVLTSKEVKNLCTLEENKPEYKFSPKITQEFKEHILKLEATDKSGGLNFQGSNHYGSNKKTNTNDGNGNNYQDGRIDYYKKIIEILIEAGRFTDISSILDLKFLAEDKSYYTKILNDLDEQLSKESGVSDDNNLLAYYETCITKLETQLLQPTSVIPEKIKSRLQEAFDQRMKLFIKYCLSEPKETREELIKKTFSNLGEKDFSSKELVTELKNLKEEEEKKKKKITRFRKRIRRFKIKKNK